VLHLLLLREALEPRLPCNAVFYKALGSHPDFHCSGVGLMATGNLEHFGAIVAGADLANWDCSPTVWLANDNLFNLEQAGANVTQAIFVPLSVPAGDLGEGDDFRIVLILIDR